MKVVKLSAIFVLLISLMVSCNKLGDLGKSLFKPEDIKFRVSAVSGLRLAGIDISNKKSISDFSISDGLKLASAYKTKSLQSEFIVDVEAKNPNNGSGGLKALDARLDEMEWTLFIDGKQTIAGGLANPVNLPGTGAIQNLGLRVNLDFVQFFGNKGYDDLLNLILALGGANANTSNIVLEATPRISVTSKSLPGVKFSTPAKIRITDKSF